MQKLIYDSVTCIHKQQRTAAEQAVTRMLQDNPEGFIIECASIASNQQFDEEVRQAAATILGRAATLKMNGVPSWDRVSPQNKQALKTTLVNLLISPQEKVRRAGGSLIASIMSIEVQRGNWTDLIIAFVQNIDNPDAIVKKTSITTLGFVCQQLKQAAYNIELQLSQSILTGILKGLREDQALQTKEVALIALRNALPFLWQLMANQSVAQYTLKTIFHSPESIRKTAIQVLIQFAKCNYQNLGEYLKPMAAFTCPMMLSESNQGVACMQLWDSIGQQYLQRKQKSKLNVSSSLECQNYLLKVNQTLVPVMLQAMLVVDVNSQNNLKQAAYKALSTVCECCGSITFQIIKTFVSNTISSLNWKERQSSVLAFSCICQSQQKETVAGILSLGLDVFMGLLSDQNQFVVESTLQGLYKIAGSHYAIILQSPSSQKYLSSFVHLLNSNKHQVVDITLNILQELMSHLKDVGDCAPKNKMKPMLDALLNIVLAWKDPTAVSRMWAIINYLLEVCDSNELAFCYIEQLYKIKDQFKGRSQLSSIQTSGIFATISACLRVLVGKCPTQSLFKQLYSMVIQHFLSIQDVDTDGMYLMSAMVHVYRKTVGSVLESYWPYLERGLQKVNQPETYKAALANLGDIARAQSALFLPHFNSKIQMLIRAIGSDVHRNIKLSIFSTLSDLITSVGEHGQPYIESLLGIVELGFQGAIQLSKNPDDFDYSEELKQAALDLYQGILFSSRANSRITTSFPRILALIIETCQKRYKSTVDYLCSCINVLTTIAGQHTNLRYYLRTDEFRTVLNILKEYARDSEKRDLVIFSQRMVFERS